MLIGGLQKLTLIDYPGKIAATVFLVGCNFSCPWCYNPELVLAEDINKHAKISEKDFFDFLKQRKGLLDGVAICGGEPTINKNLPDFIKKIKKLGYAVKLDTNGSNPEMLKNLIDEKLIDYVAMDVKALLKIQNYSEAIGKKTALSKIKRSVEIVKKSGINYEFRTTIIPKLHQLKDIVDIAKQLKGAKKYFLQQFKPEKTINPKYKKYKPFGQKQLETIQKKCNKYLPTELRNL